ncbi:MAG: isochorismatase family protein [Armatimonadetes bacterium]|nr:isochorismatase family protein [Armatimonadota bacterium]
MRYHNRLRLVSDGPPILADHPDFVAPLAADERFLAPPVVDEPDADLTVRCWRWWYNARGLVEMECRLRASATALLIVHPWGIDDGHGLETPEPAGCAFFCTKEKNTVVAPHLQQVINPLLARLRPRLALVGYSMPGVEDDARRLLYASVRTEPEALDPAAGERRLREVLAAHPFTGEPLIEQLMLADDALLHDYRRQTPSTDAGDRTNGPGYWQLPMPVHAALDRAPTDRVFYDGEGYPLVRDFLRARGVRHVLLCGYATDMCVKATTCGYDNLAADFNVFLVGDATLATFPASQTPALATQVALCNAALHMMISQAGWIV